jgi:hypothetical protein
MRETLRFVSLVPHVAIDAAGRTVSGAQNGRVLDFASQLLEEMD